MTKISFIARAVLLSALCVLALGLTACGVNVKEKDSGNGDKEVTIQSPVGNMHVGEDVKGADTGLTVYPGATLVQKGDDGGSNRANVNISTSLFGLKLVVVKYASDDAPEKLVAFYSNDLKRYGKVLQCRKSGMGPDVKMSIHDDDKESKASRELTCTGDGKGETIEIKVGTNNNEHIVAVSPKGKGSEFALVYVHTRDDSTI
jgi:hypothetical protein